MTAGCISAFPRLGGTLNLREENKSLDIPNYGVNEHFSTIYQVDFGPEIPSQDLNVEPFFSFTFEYRFLSTI